MASEFEIRQKQKGGEAKRQKDLAKKKASQQASIKAKLKTRLKDAEARLKALTNPVSAKDKKDAKSNLGEIRRLKASIAEFKKRLGMKSDDSKKTKDMTKNQRNTKVGEGVEIQLKCEHCEESNEHKIDLESLKTEIASIL